MPHTTTTWVLACGVFNLVLALFHLSFWKLFRWPASLAESGRVNRAVTQILNLAVTYLFTMSALLCLLYSAELGTTAPGRFWLFAMAVFWLMRALIQPLFFGLGHALSITLFCVFGIGAAIHGVAWAIANGA